MVTLIISGKNATGKTEICKYLVNKYGFEAIEIRGLLKELYPNEPNLAKSLYSTKKEMVLNSILPSLLKKIAHNKHTIVEGILSPEELKLFKTKMSDFYLIYLDSGKSIRLERITSRVLETKLITDKTPKEQLEISDEFRVKIMSVEQLKKVADLIITNNSKKREDFHSVTEQGLRKMFIKRLTNILRNKIASNKATRNISKFKPKSMKPR